MTAVRVIKEGDPERAKSVLFECERCGCVWEANGKEYRRETDCRNGHYCIMVCPTCGRDATRYPEDEKHDSQH